ncbi:MAG: S8 family peptidase [Cruoricaptor ignavus]|nr:S8 family peptidase [Cruoricaptor ignavus]
MKKITYSIFLLGFSLFLNAQEKTKLNQEFEKQYQDNLKQLERYLSKNTSKKNDSANTEILKQNLATFVNGAPLLWKSEDEAANITANIPALQNTTIAGLDTSIDGTGINILIMDTGKIFANHNEFENPDRITLKETDTAQYSPHSTMVTGVIGAVGKIGTAKGILPNATFDNYFFGTTSLGTNYQKLEAATSANISNHSYGTNLGWSQSGNAWYWFGDYELYKTTKQDTYSGSYHELDANYDKIVYANPNQVVVKSTGNYYGLVPPANATKYKIDNSTGNYIPFTTGEELPPANCNNGYYCIGWGALAKNIITVGAVNKLGSDNIYTEASQVTRWANSSAGPRKDGAIKPDISAVGQNIYAPTYTTDTGVTSYSTTQGTSFSAAMISGIAGALTQVNRTLTGNSDFIYQADEMKALLTHTANEAGNIGPDVWFGWGLADAKKAAEIIIAKHQDKAVFEQRTLTSGVADSFEIKAGNEPLKATISWVDPAAEPFTTPNDLQNNHASRLVNDLDLRLVDTVNGTVYYPWRLNEADPLAQATKGDNTVDNVEQVAIDNPVVGRTYRVEVSNKGTLVDDAGAETNSKYTIVASGLLNSDGLSSDCASISVYPTRVKDFTTIIVPMVGERISIYDTSGRLVSTTTQATSQTMDLSGLKAGIYLIQVRTQYCNQTKKIIKE